MRALIEDMLSDRFRISQEDIPVVEDQLHPVNYLSSLVDVTDHTAYFHNEDDETYAYEIQFEPFMITQKSNGVVTMVINADNMLYVEYESNTSKRTQQ